MKIWMNGHLVDRAEAGISVFDHGILYGDGVFEGIRSYHGKIFQPKAHMDRLFRSAEMISLEIPYTAEELIAATYETMKANGKIDSYIRMVVTRGIGNLGVSPQNCEKACVFIIVGNIAMYSPDLYANGMPVIIGKTVRTGITMLSPEIKSLNYLNNVMAKLEGIKAGVMEVLMTNVDGNICEATGDNVFIVKNSKVITPPREAGILLGVTRSTVMHIARREGLEVSEHNICPLDVYGADECFLTGTGAEVIPVTKVDDATIGDGKVGLITRRLIDAFREFVKTDEQIPYAGL